MFVCTYTYMCIWVYTGEANAKRIRERYLKAVLRQDIAFFDRVGPGEVATRIQTDTRQYSCSYHSLHFNDSCSATQIWFNKAYVRSWRLALALTTIIPCIGITGGVMNKFITKFTQLVLFCFFFGRERIYLLLHFILQLCF